MKRLILMACALFVGCSCERRIEVKTSADHNMHDVTSQVRIPTDLERRTVRSLQPGEGGYIHRLSIFVDSDGLMFVEKDAGVYEKSEGAYDARILRSPARTTGLVLTLPDATKQWTRGSHSMKDSNGYMPVVSLKVGPTATPPAASDER